MSSVLYNPTDKLDEEFQETFPGMYLGKAIDIKPGAKIELDDKAARHLLNNFASRGLISLVYGDDGEKEEKKIKTALDRNRTFKIKQINDYNEKNEARKHQGLPYLWPHKQVKAYAKEFGAKLIESYKIDDAQLQKSKELEDENIKLKVQMAEMNGKMEKLMEMVSGKISAENVPEPEVKPEQVEESVKKKENILNVRDGPKK